VPLNEFYDYEAKYVKEGSELVIPAKLSREQMRSVKDLALRAFRAVDCAGMARVDFLLDRPSGTLFVNEVNTIPGFTPISMYPKLWEASGLPYPNCSTASSSCPSSAIAKSTDALRLRQLNTLIVTSS